MNRAILTLEHIGFGTMQGANLEFGLVTGFPVESCCSAIRRANPPPPGPSEYQLFHSGSASLHSRVSSPSDRHDARFGDGPAVMARVASHTPGARGKSVWRFQSARGPVQMYLESSALSRLRVAARDGK